MKHDKNLTIIGLDIGGTKIEGILWRRGRVLGFQKISTPKTKIQFCAALVRLIFELARLRQFDAIGVAIAGNLDTKTGRVLKSPNLRFLEGFDIAQFLLKKIHKPVRVGNDAKCFLRAELRFGQGRNFSDVLVLTLGTGVGGGVFSGGRVLVGAHGSGLELGHILLLSEKRRYLSLEDLVSGHGFRRLGIRDPLACQNQAFAGDRKAKKIYQKIGEYLGAGLSTLINIFDPQIIILGGGIARAFSLFMPSVRKMLRQYMLSSLKHSPRLVSSKLAHPGALGAVSLFL